ncbi:MAG TPA: hypothetical protein VIK69_08010 [Methylophilaceae bacterium]
MNLNNMAHVGTAQKAPPILTDNAKNANIVTFRAALMNRIARNIFKAGLSLSEQPCPASLNILIKSGIASLMQFSTDYTHLN